MTKAKSDHYLTKLKLALASGGLLATMIGAGLLGREAASSAAYTSPAPAAQPAASTGSRSQVTINASIPPDLDLNLEEIPTMVAPVVRSAPVAMGRSSG